MKVRILQALVVLSALINIWWFWPGSLYFLNDDLLHIPLTDQGHLFQTNSVRPIHELLVRLDLFLWNKEAYGYHITALLLHFIVCIQLYYLSLAIQIKWLNIDRRQAKEASLLAVVLFLIYPQSSESIAWIIGRTPVLSSIFFMITIRLFFVKNYPWYVCLTGALCFAVALFTYEQCVLLPVALLLVAYSNKLIEKRQSMFIYVFALGLVDLGYIIARKLITSQIVSNYEGGNLLTDNWTSLAENAVRLFLRLVLSPTYKSAFMLSVVIMLLLAILIITKVRKMPLNKKAIFFFTVIIFLFIVPVISLGIPLNSFESGRYLYIPSIFLVIGISIAGIQCQSTNAKLTRPLAILLVGLSTYWLIGKYTASRHYLEASQYASLMEQKIQQHFKSNPDSLHIDTLRVNVHGLPVFQLGFKTGINWLNQKIDTNKIIVRTYYDDFSKFY